MNNRQSVFVEEYLKDFNASRAARAAGYSKKTAGAIGHENLKNIEIAKAIQDGITERQMGQDEIKLRLADMARGDIADLADIRTTGFTFNFMVEGPDGGMVVNPKTKLIKKIKQKVTTITPNNGLGEDREIVETEIELYDAQAALEKLARISGMLKDNVDLTSGGKTIEVIIGPKNGTELSD